jgi:hypothetical protein
MWWSQQVIRGSAIFESEVRYCGKPIVRKKKGTKKANDEDMAELARKQGKQRRAVSSSISSALE